MNTTILASLLIALYVLGVFNQHVLVCRKDQDDPDDPMPTWFKIVIPALWPLVALYLVVIFAMRKAR